LRQTGASFDERTADIVTRSRRCARVVSARAESRVTTWAVAATRGTKMKDRTNSARRARGEATLVADGKIFID
jgi:hypothetical protein